MRLFMWLTLLATGVPVWGQESWIGTVKLAQGSVSVERAAAVLPVSEGLRLQVGDVIRSGPDGRVAALLHDGTRCSLGPATELRLDRFVYEPGQSRFGLVMKLLRGIGVFVSGKIAEFSPDSVKVETPTAVVGLRGTEFAIRLE
jgi:hypothetical protein